VRAYLQASSFEGRFTPMPVTRTKQDSLRVYKVMLPGTRPSINYQSLLKYRDIGPNKLTHASNKPTHSSYFVYDWSHTQWHMLAWDHHSHDDDQKKRHATHVFHVVLIQWTHGTAVPWVGQTKSPSFCAHTRLT
jgi:hypothetical protein